MQKDVNADEYLQIQNLSHEEINDFSVRTAIEAAKKLQRLQEERNPGGDDYWPYVLVLKLPKNYSHHPFFCIFRNLYDHKVTWGTTPAGNPFGVMYVMLIQALEAQCTPEQYEEFGKRMKNFEICGTYAQTELGHGTFLRGLETRADFDPKTDEFVLNTPKISSYKFWPGGCKFES